MGMRTTLALEDDASKALQQYARGNRMSLGKAASELIRRGVRYQLGTRKLNGIPVLDVPDDFPVVTSEKIRQLAEEE